MQIGFLVGVGLGGLGAGGVGGGGGVGVGGVGVGALVVVDIVLVTKPEDVDEELLELRDVVDDSDDADVLELVDVSVAAVSDAAEVVELLAELAVVDEGAAPLEVADCVGSAASPHTNMMSPSCHCSSPWPWVGDVHVAQLKALTASRFVTGLRHPDSGIVTVCRSPVRSLTTCQSDV